MPSVGLVFRSQRVSILLFCAATFFFWASLYLYVPVLPVYAKSLGASLSMVGAVISSYAIAQLVLRIPIGLFADILGKRKPLVVAGIVASAVGALGLGLAPSPWPLFLARAATGVGAATWVVFPVLFASYYPREQAMRAIGIISFVNGAAIVVATYAGGVIAQLWGFAPVFFGAVSLGVMGLVAVLPAKEPVVQRTRPVSWGGFVRVATHPLLLTVSGISILLHFVIFSGVFGFIPVYAEKIGASRADLGVMTMLSMGSGALASLGVAYMAERWGYRATIVVGSVVLGVATVSVPFVQQVAFLDVLQVGNGIGRGILATLLLALSIQVVDPDQRATAMGVYQALYAIGMFLGPLVSGLLADSFGLASVFYVSAVLSVAVGALAWLPMLSARHG